MPLGQVPPTMPELLPSNPHPNPPPPQAYTSQFISLVMFGLMMSEDRLSLQNRRHEIIRGLKALPGKCHNSCPVSSFWADSELITSFSSKPPLGSQIPLEVSTGLGLKSTLSPALWVPAASPTL